MALGKDLEVHAAAAAAAAVAVAVGAAARFLRGRFGHHAFGGDHEAGVDAKRLVAAQRPNEAAFCSAVPVTLVGSTMPNATLSPASPLAALWP